MATEGKIIIMPTTIVEMGDITGNTVIHCLYSAICGMW